MPGGIDGISDLHLVRKLCLGTDLSKNAIHIREIRASQRCNLRSPFHARRRGGVPDILDMGVIEQVSGCRSKNFCQRSVAGSDSCNGALDELTIFESGEMASVAKRRKGLEDWIVRPRTEVEQRSEI